MCAVNLQIFLRNIFVLYLHVALSITAIHSLCCYYLYLHIELSSAQTDPALPTQHAFHSLCCGLRLKCDGTRAETRFRLSAKRTSPIKSAGGGASVQLTTGSRGVHISDSNAGYTMFWGSVKGTGYPLHSPLSASLPLPSVTMCHHISIGVYEEAITWGGRWYSVNCSGYRASNYIRTEHGKSWSVGV